MRTPSFSHWITIGITGATKLPKQTVPSLRQGTEEAIRTIRIICPEARLRIVTSLAPGADRLVAEVALEVGNISIQPILPLPETQYAKASPTLAPERYWVGEKSHDLGRFFRTLKEADCLEDPLLITPQGPVPLAQGGSGSVDWEGMLVKNDEANRLRRRQYALAGMFVALQANHLLVMYDGHADEQRTYGTYGIERAKLKGLLPPEAFLRPVGEEVRPNRKLFSQASLEWTWSDIGVVERIWVDEEGNSFRQYKLPDPENDSVIAPRNPNEQYCRALLNERGALGIHWNGLRERQRGPAKGL